MSHRLAVAALLTVLLSSTPTARAGTHRMVGRPGAGGETTADVLKIGSMSGAAISGSVGSVQGAVITLQSGGAPAIRIDATNAKFLANRDAAASIADVQPGVRVTAFIDTSTTIAAGAALPAQLITIESLADITLTGPVQSIDVAGSKLAILGITVAVDANTSYGSAFPTFAPITGLSGIAVGQVVHVTAAFANGAILAKRLQVISPTVPPSHVLGGTVKSISSTSWVITGKDGKDTTITIDAQTKITGDPKVGDWVQVMATIDSAHNYVAILIAKVEQRVDNALHGWVASIAPSEWTIGGPPGSMAPVFTVRITTTTVIYPNPQVGDRVTVVGKRDAAGIFTASKIAKE
ncbi:MAG TPA: DUF5666 domain-containing protein [Thermoanaerobaculia bacterium]|nr:DUF5666 domain-containing protein [Thermoanaerobaculia bacterium]